MPGDKPNPFPLALFFALEGLAVIGVAVLLLWRRRGWALLRSDPGRVFIVTLALLHIPLMIFTSPLDRYYLPVVGLLAPVTASLVSHPGAASAVTSNRGALRFSGSEVWALAVMIVFLCVYAVGEQDYQAWQMARDQAARLAYRSYPADRVDAGYEAVATYVAVPQEARTGHTDINTIDLHPPDPVVQLEFSSPRDPRPGVDYQSLAPGRIVIAPARH
jgi:hypothetical protein